ncbi:MAG: (Fe-S)-binding protein [Myxococcota bacterium]|nr:(Fe-S)-binding protein [Myxococcota bacterium]
MKVGLFVPCYVDQFAPAVAWASLQVLERAGCSVSYPDRQTCCGQPFLNLGASREATRLARRHLDCFSDVDAVVCPSGSCAAMVRLRYPEIGVGTTGPSQRVRSRTFELGEFLVRELGCPEVGAVFPHRVALLQSCHGLRDLELGTPSERAGAGPGPGSTELLLRAVRGLEFVTPERPDECCGFGGAFSVEFPEISGRIGRDRLRALADTGAEYVTGTDTSCLLHLDGLRRRNGFGPRAIHLAEILATEEA